MIPAHLLPLLQSECPQQWQVSVRSASTSSSLTIMNFPVYTPALQPVHDAHVDARCTSAKHRSCEPSFLPGAAYVSSISSCLCSKDAYCLSPVLGSASFVASGSLSVGSGPVWMAGAISAIYILDSKGKQLIARDFRGDTPAGCVERFVGLVTGALPILFCKATIAK